MLTIPVFRILFFDHEVARNLDKPWLPVFRRLTGFLIVLTSFSIGQTGISFGRICFFLTSCDFEVNNEPINSIRYNVPHSTHSSITWQCLPSNLLLFTGVSQKFLCFPSQQKSSISICLCTVAGRGLGKKKKKIERE